MSLLPGSRGTGPRATAPSVVCARLIANMFAGTGPRATATLDTLFWQEGLQFAGARPSRDGPLCSLRSPDRKHVRGGQAPALRYRMDAERAP